MRYYKIHSTVENTYSTLSEKQILESYYSQWYKKMCDQYEQAFVDATFSFEDCLEYWVISNRAELVKQ